MLLLFSSFSPAFEPTLARFTTALKAKKRVVLLLQGGPDHDEYLPQYLEPLKNLGIENVKVIIPPCTDEEVAEAITKADGVFIGGGQTARYVELYSGVLVRLALRKHLELNRPLAGLSAGAIVLTKNIVDEESAQVLKGLDFVPNYGLLPHFDSDYGLADLARRATTLACPTLGLEEEAVLLRIEQGPWQNIGTGSVWRLATAPGRGYRLDEYGPGVTFGQ